MAYIATFLPFCLFTSLALTVAIFCAHGLRRREVSQRILRGVIGSAFGFIVSPPIAALAGLIPDLMIQPEYFAQPFLGCISPASIFLLYATTAFAVLAGFVGGFCFGRGNRGSELF